MSLRHIRSGNPARASGGIRRRALAVIGGCACCLTLATASPAEEPTPADVTNPPAPSADDLTPAALLDDLESTARQKQARLERLREHLLQLAEQSRRRSAPHKNATPPEPSTLDPHAVPPPPDEPDFPAPDAPGSGVGDRPPDQQRQTSHGAAANTEHAVEPLAHGERHAEDSDAHGRARSDDVAGTRVNRLALGDSLFASGQTDLALQAYSSIELTRLPAADRHWIEYQTANCYRRLGDIAEAEKRYRRLAGMIDGGWYAAHARWWLDALSTRTDLQRELATIQTTLQTIKEQLEDPSNEQATR